MIFTTISEIALTGGMIMELKWHIAAIFFILLIWNISREPVQMTGCVAIANFVLLLRTIHRCLSCLDEGAVPEVLPSGARLLLAMRAHAQTFLRTLLP